MSVIDFWSHVKSQFDARCAAQLQPGLTLSKFTWTKAGGIGQQYPADAKAKPGKPAETYNVFVDKVVDTVDLDGRKLQIGWSGKAIEIPPEKLDQLMQIPGGLDALLEEQRDDANIELEQLVWAGKSSNAVAINGLRAAGDGTFENPTLVDGGTSYTKWGAAGNAQNALAALSSVLEAKGFPRPYALFYPLSGAVLMKMPLLMATATFAGLSVEQYALQSSLFQYVIGVGNTKAATPLCLMTGAAETSTDTQMYAASLPSVDIWYTEMLNQEYLIDAKSKITTYRVGARCTPRVLSRNIGGTHFKGVCELDAITTAAS